MCIPKKIRRLNIYSKKNPKTKYESRPFRFQINLRAAFFPLNSSFRRFFRHSMRLRGVGGGSTNYIIISSNRSCFSPHYYYFK